MKTYFIQDISPKFCLLIKYRSIFGYVGNVRGNAIISTPEDASGVHLLVAVAKNNGKKHTQPILKGKNTAIAFTLQRTLFENS